MVKRRLSLVLLIFGVTTASAIWAVSRQQTFYQASLSLQVNDPLQRTRSLTPGTRVSGMELFIDPIRTLLFTNPGPAEGKSTTAVNFAVMLAQQGKRVLLVDSDLSRPALHRAVDLLREPGLTNLLVGDATPREAVRPNILPNLDILPSGPFPPNPSELLNSKTMKRLLKEFEEKYDQVVIDSPPMPAVTDSAVLSVHTDGVVLVLRSGETEQRAAERAVDQLRRLDVRVFGAVLNGVSAAASEDSYYLQYYYSYEPERKKGEEARPRPDQGGDLRRPILVITSPAGGCGGGRPADAPTSNRHPGTRPPWTPRSKFPDPRTSPYGTTPRKTPGVNA